MFETQIEEGPSFVAFVLQQLAVPVVSFLLLVFLGVCMEQFGSGLMSRKLVENLLPLGVAPVLGFLFGSAMRRLIPSARQTGR